MRIQKPLRITKGNNSKELAPSPYILIISIYLVYMNDFARFDEIPTRTLQDIMETKHYGRMHGRTFGWTDNVKTVYPPTNTVCGGINTEEQIRCIFDYN